jgi:hypothetical protein
MFAHQFPFGGGGNGAFSGFPGFPGAGAAATPPHVQPHVPKKTMHGDDFELPTDIPPDAWKEFHGCSMSDVKTKVGPNFRVQYMSLHGIELLEKYVYDPESTLVGLWADKGGRLHGAARIRMID